MSNLEDSIKDGGEVAMNLEYDKEQEQFYLKGYAIAKDKQFSELDKRNLYLQKALGEVNVLDKDKVLVQGYFLGKGNIKEEKIVKPEVSVYTKYKPVALKVKPVYTELPEKFRIKREIKGDPLRDLPKLNPNPPEYKSIGRYTQERKDIIDQVHKGDFLWPEERKLMHHLLMEQNEAFAWDDTERGRFREDFFPSIVIPAVEHTPWVYKNIPIPSGIFEEVCDLVRKKIEAGVYEPSNASYRSRWFTVLKKDGKSLRIVHSLEPLNAVTIAHSGLPPATEELASKFAGRACGGMFDLYVGYDERLLAEESRDLTTFQTPFGALRLVTLPMGWTNSVPIFHDDVTEILKPEIPEFTVPYIDDVPVRGPPTRYEKVGGGFETIKENNGIRRFVWEHMNNVNRILQRMKYCGGTFSGKKTVVCAESIEVLGHKCDYEGQKPTEDKIGVIMRWTKCDNLRDVRSFLGITGILRPYIKNYGILAHELNCLKKKNIPFEWGHKQIESMEAIKEGVRTAQAIRPLDYEGQGPIVLAVDTSYIAIGFYIYQEDVINPKRHYFAKFGSRVLNDREARFSQPKRELFGLKEALRMNKKWLFGVRKLIVETDAKYIKGMLTNPDMMPNATINRWIDEILMYHFTLRHKAGATFGPDGLSRRPRQESDPIPDRDEADNFEEPELKSFEIAEGTDTQPLEIKDFVDQIDSRGGYFQGIAKSMDDFSLELERATEDRKRECIIMRKRLQLIPNNTIQAEYVQQLVESIEEQTESVKQDLPYDEDHRSPGAKIQDELMPHIEHLLKDRNYRPKDYSEKEIKRLLRLVKRFLLYEEKLYRRGYEGQHRLYVQKMQRTYMMTSAHDNNGHRGFFATKSLLTQRFWWPEMEKDINQFVKTCHPCQERRLNLIKSPPVKTHTPSIFERIHADIMHMTPPSNGCKYIIHGRCGLTKWAEAKALRDEKARSIAMWLYEDILCRWGGLCLIVTDNAEPFKAAAKWIEQKWGIKHITISPYNSQANELIERGHWDIRQCYSKLLVLIMYLSGTGT